MTKEQKQEYTLKITQANKSEIIVLIYEIALNYLEESEEALEKKESVAFRTATRNVQKCIGQLMESLNFDYEISNNLLELYCYANREIMKAVTKKEAEYLINAKKVIKNLLEAFREVSAQDKTEAVMSNTQTVYAGLTYGRTSLNESVQGEGSARGYWI